MRIWELKPGFPDGQLIDSIVGIFPRSLQCLNRLDAVEKFANEKLRLPIIAVINRDCVRGLAVFDMAAE